MTQEAKQLRARVRWGIIGIFVLLIALLAFIFPSPANTVLSSLGAVGLNGLTVPEKPFQLGLDLQGGAHLVYRADVSAIEEEEQGTAVDGVRDVIERRVNSIGVGEPNVQTTHVGDDYRILVELPGVTDVNQAIRMIGETPILEFKEENDVPPRELTEEEQARLEQLNADAKQKATEAAAALARGDEFASVVQQYSEDTLSKNNDGYLGFLTRRQIDARWYDWAVANEPGAVTKTPIEHESGYALLQRGESREGETAVTARHILICYLGARDCEGPIYTKQQAQEVAQQVFDEANAENFTQLVEQYSTDATTRDAGGDLGQIYPGLTEPAFEQAVFAAEAGQIIGPVNTPYGFHIIYKTGEEPSQDIELSAVLIQRYTEEDIVPPEESWKNTGLSGRQLERAEVVQDPNTSAIQVALQFDAEGGELFAELTRRNVGKSIAIFLDGSPISIPTVNQEITGGQAVITGNFSLLEARELAQRLNTGALPVPVELLSQQTVGATLGAESLAQSLKAGVIGVAIVMIFMLAYYRLPGLISVITLTLYICLILAIFKVIGVTLTLAGIAGLILSVGMAVDANVLIFERLKEELRGGKSLKVAVEEGFLRAWTSIRDGNISTLLIAAILLFTFQSSFVRGFAVTLSIGILLSMFSAITITRMFLRFVVPWFEQRGHWLFLGRKKA